VFQYKIIESKIAIKNNEYFRELLVAISYIKRRQTIWSTHLRLPFQWQTISEHGQTKIHKNIDDEPFFEFLKL